MRVLTPALVCFAWCGTVWAQPVAPKPIAISLPSPNALMIVGVTPVTFADGIETEVAVTVAYELVDAPAALIEIVSNAVPAQKIHPFASQRVEKGSGTITLREKFRPRFWTPTLVPKIGAALIVPDVEFAPRKAVAADQRRITLTLTPETDAAEVARPASPVIAEDGISIKSIVPDRFVEGQAVDVEVTVSYELLSHEGAEIVLGFSNGRATGYSSAARVPVKIGRGEIVLRGRMMPKTSGALRFAKVHVDLFEVPRRIPSVAIANDAETVRVN